MRWIVWGAWVALLLAGARPSDAGIVTLTAAARGWVYQSGFANGRAADNNTFTGWAADSGDVNSWFGFDLTPVTGSVVAAELLLDIDGYTSEDASETLVLRHLATPPGVLGTIDSVAHFDDLMTGTMYGSGVFTEADEGRLRALSLNQDAIADIDSATGGMWEIGGHVVTLSRSGPPESIFWGTFGDPETTQLRITTAAEPTSLSALALGLVALLGTARRRR